MHPGTCFTAPRQQKASEGIRQNTDLSCQNASKLRGFHVTLTYLRFPQCELHSYELYTFLWLVLHFVFKEIYISAIVIRQKSAGTRNKVVILDHLEACRDYHRRSKVKNVEQNRDGVERTQGQITGYVLSAECLFSTIKNAQQLAQVCAVTLFEAVRYIANVVRSRFRCILYLITGLTLLLIEYYGGALSFCLSATWHLCQFPPRTTKWSLE